MSNHRKNFNHRGHRARMEFNPEFAVAIYYGLQILAATLVYCCTPRASHGGAKGNYWHVRAFFVSPYRMKQHYPLHV